MPDLFTLKYVKNSFNVDFSVTSTCDLLVARKRYLIDGIGVAA